MSEDACGQPIKKSHRRLEILAMVVAFAFLFYAAITLVSNVANASERASCDNIISLSQSEIISLSQSEIAILPLNQLKESSKALRKDHCARYGQAQAVVDRQLKIIDQVIVEKYDAAISK